MPLSRRLIAAYSSVAFAAELQSTFWGLYALHFLTENVGLEPLYTGILILLYRTWDAINDTLFGFLSDRTTSARWGKRRGWMMAGTLPYVITFALYWYPPFGENEGSELYSHNVRQAITFAWYFFLLFVCDAGFSAVNVAYLSLLGDITADPQEKFSISLWRSIVLGIGSIVSIIASAIISYGPVEDRLFGGEHLRGWIFLSIIFGTIYTGSVLVCVYETAGISVTGARAPSNAPSTFKAFRQTFSRLIGLSAVRLAVIIQVSTVTAVQFSIACLAYFFLDVLKVDESKMATVILTAVCVATVVGILVKACLSHAEKKSILRAGLIVWMAFYVILSVIFEPGWYMYPAAAVMGIGLGLAIPIPLAMVTDTADIVEHQLGERHDGVLFGMLQLFNKFLLGIMLMLFQIGLQLSGFVKGQPMSYNAELAIRLGLLLPIAALMLAYWANSNSPVSKGELARIAADLASRRNPRDDIELLVSKT